MRALHTAWWAWWIYNSQHIYGDCIALHSAAFGRTRKPQVAEHVKQMLTNVRCTRFDTSSSVNNNNNVHETFQLKWIFVGNLQPTVFTLFVVRLFSPLKIGTKNVMRSRTRALLRINVVLCAHAHTRAHVMCVHKMSKMPVRNYIKLEHFWVATTGKRKESKRSEQMGKWSKHEKVHIPMWKWLGHVHITFHWEQCTHNEKHVESERARKKNVEMKYDSLRKTFLKRMPRHSVEHKHFSHFQTSLLCAVSALFFFFLLSFRRY